MKRIKVPTFLVGQFQDEQTGGHFAESLGGPERATRRCGISLQNGVHADSLGPSTITRWAEFLKLYVGERDPGDPVVGARPERRALQATSPTRRRTPVHAVALREHDGRGRREGGCSSATRACGCSWTTAAGPRGRARSARRGSSASTPGRSAGGQGRRAYYLGAGGALASQAGGGLGRATPPTGRAPAQTLPGDGAERRLEGAAALQLGARWPRARASASSPARSPGTSVIAGPSSLDVYLKSSAQGHRPAGHPQRGAARRQRDLRPERLAARLAPQAERRARPRRSTRPDPPRARRARRCPRGRYSLVRVPIFPVAHAFRAGSRIRVTIKAPGGDRPRWDFATVDKGTTRNTIGLGGARASRLVLPVVAGATAKGTPLPGADRAARRAQPPLRGRRPTAAEAPTAQYPRVSDGSATPRAAARIGAPGFEPGTSPTRTVRATRLRHAPKRASMAKSRPASAGVSRT